MREQIALVTGAGSGLGAAIAARLAADGALVAVNDLDRAAAEKVAADVGGEAAVFDVVDAGAFDAAVDGLVERHGRIDVLVNNAGIAPARPEVIERSISNGMARMSGGEVVPLAATSTLTDEAWDRMIKVHLYGTFNGTRAALRHMEPARSGSIVNMASILGISGAAGAAEYAAAKAGIAVFTKSVGAEVAPLGIRVNAVAPGYIDTPLLDPMEGPIKEMIKLRTGAGRLGRAEEVAAMVAFLAGPEASFCFGEVMTLTGALGG